MGGWKWLLLVYLMAAGGYGGWRAAELWSGWGIWAVGLVPVVVVVPLGLYGTARTRVTSLLGPTLLVALLGAAFMGACAIGIAAAVGHTTRDWADPAVRAGVGAAAVGLCVGFILATRRPRPAEAADAAGSGPDEGRA